MAEQEGELWHQLESLKSSKRDLVHRITALKQQIMAIESQEKDAIQGLEREQTALEGEHRTQMEQLQEDQEKINHLKHQQHTMLDRTARQREREQKAIEREREKLLMLEERQHQLVQQMRDNNHAASGGGTGDSPTFSPSPPITPLSLLHPPSPTTPTSDLARLRESLQRELENQRRIFDDLEFQQLEAEARFEEEKERLGHKLMQDQQQLLVKYKAREDRLQEIDSQQKEMVGGVKATLETLERDRLQLIDTFNKEKRSAAEVQARIAEVSRMLSLPPSSADPDADTDAEAEAAASSDQPDSSSTFKASSPAHIEDRSDSARNLFLNTHFLNFEVGVPEGDRGAEGRTTPGGKEDSEKSSILQQIERNRSLFMEQQGGFIMDQERRRIEELRRRAADEGRALWEERRLREANCKSFNSLESEDSSIASSCDTPSEKETRVYLTTKSLTFHRTLTRHSWLYSTT
ncbi:hypothetical protein ACOMHN_000643 [Nucella lapillus]